MDIRKDANYIIKNTLNDILPDNAVKRELEKIKNEKNIYLVAIGKAAWQMANAAKEVLKENIKDGIVITKYNHSKGNIENIKIYEAGHPIPDENSFKATAKVIEMVKNLTEKDNVLFLVSGGGSSLFEESIIDINELSDITKQLLSCGADIVEINTIRKRLSKVKGGKFANICYPAKIKSIVLSDIISDPLDMIASGPAYPDSSSCEDAKKISEKYNLKLSEKAREALNTETPKKLENVETVVSGSVKNMCLSAKKHIEKLGYKAVILTDNLTCEAREAGTFIGSIARTFQECKKSTAFIFGGETVVHIKGSGKGGRNQEIALSAAQKLSGLKDTAVFSLGSDGTDGPTDAAGGYSDENTENMLRQKNIDIYKTLEENDSYNALKKVNSLIITGPTGTNVNDITVLLIKR